MAAVGAVVDAVFGSYDVKNAKQWRDEDLLHREQEKQWREDAIQREYEWRRADLERERRVFKLENEKRIIDARHKQLAAVSQFSALLAGFTMSTIVEVQINTTNQAVMVAYGAVCCLEFIVMLTCMLTCTALLLALTRFVTHTLEGEVHQLSALELDVVSPFYDWWLRKCEHEWVLAYNLFRVGLTLFLSAMADKFVVHKFGGTSVGSADCFAKVADIVSAVNAPRVAVVVSAIGGKPKVTDLLISLLELAKQRRTAECDEILATIRKKHHDVVSSLLPAEVGEPIEKAIERDLVSVSELLRSISIMQAYNENVVEFISGHGEIWSAKVLTAVLSQRALQDGKKHQFKFVDARDFLTVEADNEHGPVVQYDLSTQKMQDILKSGEEELTHLAITGFICSTVEGVMTTLKRDGSDFTASICGRVLHASSVTIWTDVSGVLSADPRRVPESQILPEVSYQEAMELAYFGAKVIHPKTMAPAIVEDIPIYIRNTFEPEHPGTKIFDRKRVKLQRTRSNGAPTARNIVSGFSTVDDLALFNIEGSGMVGVHGTSSRLFSALDRVKVNVVLIAQASSEHSICFAVPMDCAEVAKDVINETFFKEIHVGHIDKAEYIAPISIIAAVGDQMNQTPGVCARFFGALGRAKINVLAISQGSSERNISAVVHYKDSAAALRAVHSSFFLSDQTISIGLIGLEFEENETNSIGVALLKQYHQQREFLKQRFNVDIRVRAIGTHITSKMLLDSDGDITEEALASRKDEFVSFEKNKFLDHVCADHLPHWLIIDVSNSSHHVKDLYPQWLVRKVHVMTSNINVASASTAQHHALQEMSIENELTFDPEATLAIGVPIFNTIQNFIQTGDDIQRVEYSGSRFLHALFDAVFALPDPAQADLSAMMKDLITEYKNEFTVRDIVDDVMGVRSAKKAIMIAREMGFDTEIKDVDIQSPWEESATVSGSEDAVGAWSYEYLIEHLVKASEPLKQQIVKAVADPAQELHLRQMTYIDAATGKISVRVEALPLTHCFASLKGRQGGFAFYTMRHSLHPVVVTGPIADCSITAGSLFGSTLFLARNFGARAHDCGHKPIKLSKK
ncbi:hypothetical protein BBJ29_005827 [Phytophthora kernoviae]|uniref:ACT domain-containing protein n=1 Tax=Phytophthora kernoviae TaxID=325452 RepID=A0A3F2RMM1_9STRA|nr:hypothetical protein BBP00_00005898 [Phytophthora kernoviae]RLN61216.1 hypothetical protein BBJ29_005827 [Phytophthora kernoviae]